MYSDNSTEHTKKPSAIRQRLKQDDRQTDKHDGGKRLKETMKERKGMEWKGRERKGQPYHRRKERPFDKF